MWASPSWMRNFQAMKVIGIYGLGDLYDHLVQMFKVDPTKSLYYLKDMTPRDLALFRSGRLETFEDGLYGLLLRKIPKRICSAVEKELKLTGILYNGVCLEKFPFRRRYHPGERTISTPFKVMIETIGEPGQHRLEKDPLGRSPACQRRKIPGCDGTIHRWYRYYGRPRSHRRMESKAGRDPGLWKSRIPG